MELIQSFTVDHTRIVPGIFTSRVDVLGEYKVTTYDIRLKHPNREPVVDVSAMHTLEHLIATYLRNDATEVPGATPVNCGNYLMHNLGMAKYYAKEFADYLAANAGNAAIFEYPKAERLVTEDGQKFYDS